jgi:tRNA (guanosine-2'-O-)-methyltransferase
MSTLSLKQQIFDEFAEYVSPERKQRFIDVAHERTRSIAIVLEDIYQAHNMSAVLRSAECFGIQDITIIEESHYFAVSKEIAKGASQWLTLKHYSARDGQDTTRCISDLKKQGYKIVATTPHTNDMLIQEIPLDQKIALFFGAEREGLSDSALKQADAFVKIPLYGFTESFNISVAAAICMYELTKRIRESTFDWRLTEEERIDLQLEWLCETTALGDKIRERLAKI